jgi:hypothetical protein
LADYLSSKGNCYCNIGGWTGDKSSPVIATVVTDFSESLHFHVKTLNAELILKIIAGGSKIGSFLTTRCHEKKINIQLYK